MSDSDNSFEIKPMTQAEIQTRLDRISKELGLRLSQTRDRYFDRLCNRIWFEIFRTTFYEAHGNGD